MIYQRSYQFDKLFLDEKVALPYLLFKILVCFYLIAAYIISHVDYAISSESCAIKMGGDNQNVIPVNQHSVVDTSVSLCTRSDWPYYWIYFTNWSWTLLCVSFLFDTILVVLRYKNERKHVHHVVGEMKNNSNAKGNHFTPLKI